MWFLALFSIVLCGTLSAMSLFPGVLEQIPDEARWLAGGAFVLIALYAIASRLFRRRPEGQPRRYASSIVVAVFLLLTPVLLATHTPRRLFFRLFQPDFEALLPQAPPPGEFVTVPLNADLQIYWIDHWGTDRRGGTYFRSLSGRTRSYGFAHRPNPDGSPFGNGDYAIHHLRGDWYSFSATEGK